MGRFLWVLSDPLILSKLGLAGLPFRPGDAGGASTGWETRPCALPLRLQNAASSRICVLAALGACVGVRRRGCFSPQAPLLDCVFGMSWEVAESFPAARLCSSWVLGQRAVLPSAWKPAAVGIPHGLGGIPTLLITAVYSWLGLATEAGRRD